MAGYIISIGGDDASGTLNELFSSGIYSTRMKTSSISLEGTFCDYSTMKHGDNIYFFSARKIYGIGELVIVGNDCKYSNYPGSSSLQRANYRSIKDDLLIDFGPDSANNRWICTFKPAPYFFRKGIDMDDVLSYKPDTFKMLRAFWKLSFVKIGDEENESLKEIIMLRNQETLNMPTGNIFYFNDSLHIDIASKLTSRHHLTVDDFLSDTSARDRLKHEMALEAATAYYISNDIIDIFGKWDYISHQVIASPFKPIDYMDKIDIFGYRFLPGSKIISDYLVIELKKDTAYRENVHQIMKYVDWISNEYTYGNYGMIHAYILAYDFEEGMNEEADAVGTRYYTESSHPARNAVWNDLSLVSYKFNGRNIIYDKEWPCP